MLTAITREVNAAIGSCELTFMSRVEIDIELALKQHEDYQSALSSLGCEIVSVATESGLPDSVFIEDTALVLDEIAVLCRPGAESRRAEVAGVEHVLKRYRSLASIEPPGTLDGGDLLRIDNFVYAGLSTRSNQSGIDQLSNIIAEYGYSVKTVETAKCLHLKSAVSGIAPGTVLINPDWISTSVFAEFEQIEVDKKESHAANALPVGERLIYSSSYPRTMEKMLAQNIDVVPVEVSELQKAEGAVTCCSLIITTT